MTTQRHRPPAHIGETPRQRTIAHCKAIAAKHRTAVTNRPLTLKDVQGPLRWREIVKARAEIAFYLRHERKWSFPKIGKFLGDRDHTTIMNLTSPVCRTKKRAAYEWQVKNSQCTDQIHAYNIDRPEQPEENYRHENP